MSFSATCTQAEFGALVGISQLAVSEHLASGVLIPGHTAAAWLIDYTEYLREQAATRGADGELAYQRSELARVSRERAEIKLSHERKEFTSVHLIEQVIAYIASQIRDHLPALPVQFKMRCPNLTGDDLKIVETIVAQTHNLAASMSLASLGAMDDEDPRCPPHETT
jgi:phage terminase Nu1 subunit (DNA packaging protein)